MPAPSAGTASATLAAHKVLLTLVDKNAQLMATDGRPTSSTPPTTRPAVIADAESKLAGQPHPTCLREALANIQEHWKPDARFWPIADQSLRHAHEHASI